MNIEEKLEQELGYGVGVEESPNADKREGYTRYSIKCDPDIMPRVEERLAEIEHQGLEVGGKTREVELLRSGADDQPISELGSSFVLFIANEGRASNPNNR